MKDEGRKCACVECERGCKVTAVMEKLTTDEAKLVSQLYDDYLNTAFCLEMEQAGGLSFEPYGRLGWDGNL